MLVVVESILFVVFFISFFSVTDAFAAVVEELVLVDLGPGYKGFLVIGVLVVGVFVNVADEATDLLPSGASLAAAVGVLRLIGVRRAVVGVVVVDVGRLDGVVRGALSGVVLVVEVEVVGRAVRDVGVGREFDKVGVVLVAEAEAARDDSGVRVVVVLVVVVEVADVEREAGVRDVGVRVFGVVFGVVVLLTAVPGVVLLVGADRADGLGVPGFTLDVVGVVLLVVGLLPIVLAVDVVLRGAGRTGAFFVVVALV